MGKIGDLFVRLGLKSDDYKKGMADAKKETSSFSQSLGKMKAGALAVWGAIGAGVIGFAKQLLNATNSIGDAWNRTMSQMKAGWDVFLQSVSSMNWENFVGRIREATRAAKELTNAMDAEFEVSNSVRLQKAAMAEELAELEVIARDQTRSYEERAAAAKKYLEMVKPLYDQELKLAKRLEDAQLGKWLAGSGLKDSEQLRKDLRAFLVAYGKDDNLISALGRMMELQEQYDMALSIRLKTANFTQPNAVVDEYRALRDYVKEYEKNNGYGTSIYELAKVYEKMRGDADTTPLVDAMINAGTAAGSFNQETKKMQSALHSAEAIINNSSQNVLNTAAEVISNAAVARTPLEALPALPAITSKAIGGATGLNTENYYANRMAEGEEYVQWYMSMVDRVAQMNVMLEDSIIQATTAGMEAFTDMMFGLEGADASAILGALMQPFADTATQLGGMLLAQGIAVDAFKTSLASLQGAPAIAAGLSLLAIGAAMKSGIKALAKGGGGSGSTASYGGSSYGSTAAQNYESTLTVNVVGTISGSDIALSLDRTRKNQKR